MTKALCLALAAALLATTTVHAASDLPKKAGAAPTAVVTPAPGATLRRPAIALFGLYSWGGFGLGARVEWPLAQNLIKEVAYPNEIVGVGGIEYYTQSYSLFTSNYRWNFVRIEAGAMWNFWFTDRFAVYPWSAWVMTHWASGFGFARSAMTVNGMPSHSLSRVVHPVTQCMSAVTGCGPRAFSSA